MPALSQVHANALINGSLGTAAHVAATTPIRVRLMTANGTATSNGTEVPSGGSYTAVTGISPVTFASASGGTTASNVAATQTNMPAATIVGVELWDSASTPVRRWYGALTASKTTNPGDTFTIASGSLTVTLT